MSYDSEKYYYGLQCFVFVLLSVIVVAWDKHYDSSSFLHRAFFAAVSPVQKLASLPAKGTQTFRYYFSSRQDLRKENKALHEKLLIIQSQQQFSSDLLQENSKLRRLLNVEVKSSNKVAVADILRVSEDPFLQQVTLNQGRKHYVFKGQSVIDEDGVYGQVVEVSDKTSRVMLLSDSRHAVPVVNERTGGRGVVVGNGPKKLLSLLYISKTMDVKENDFLMTSGLAGRFPAGYPVGKVVSVDEVADERFLRVNVQPFANLEYNRQVLLVWLEGDSHDT